MILAPLRGVTIRSFREVFADVIREAGFTEAITPFIPAMSGFDPLKDRELQNAQACPCPRDEGVAGTIKVTPQFIGKDPAALRSCLEKIKAAGYDTADLNCGCPFPMVRNKGRGSGILRTPDVLRRMLEVGCEVMGAGKFSIKARLGVDRNDELLALMPMINAFPLRYLTVHARTARQMYEGRCDGEMLEKVVRVAKVPIVCNGDLSFPPPAISDSQSSIFGQSPISGQSSIFGQSPIRSLMIGRSFIRYLGTRDDIGELLDRYLAVSQAELFGDRPVLGRLKELLAYWKDLPHWKRRWPVLKLARTLDELRRFNSGGKN